MVYKMGDFPEHEFYLPDEEDYKISNGNEFVGKKASVEGLTFKFLKRGLKYGFLSLGLFYKVKKCPTEEKNGNQIASLGQPVYYLEEDQRSTMIFKLVIYIILCASLLVHYISGSFFGDQFHLISIIRKIMVMSTVIYIFTAIYCLQTKKQRILDILEQGDVLQRKFAEAGLSTGFTTTFVRIAGQVVCIGVLFFCVVHRILNVLKYDRDTAWYIQPAVGLLRLISLNFTIFPEDLFEKDGYPFKIFGGISLLLEMAIFNIWYFNEGLQVLLTGVMWTVFKTLGAGLDRKVLKSNNLAQVIDLHFQATKMMDLVNDLISPITFCSVVFTLFYIGYWLNYTILEQTIRPHHMAFVVFIIKTLTVYLTHVNIHHHAHNVAAWLVEACAKTEEETKLGYYGLSTVSPIKLLIFSAQIYGKHDVGFKGFYFFTVTPTFLGKVVTIILTYSIVVTQFYIKNEN